MLQKKLIFLFLLLSNFFVLYSQIFYKIDCPNCESSSYIFGTHHLSPISIVEEAGLMEYFDKTDQVVGELDLTADPIKLSMALQPYMTAPADSTLTILLKGENIDSLNTQFQRLMKMPGVSLQTFDRLKPMVVSTLIAGNMSIETMPGYNPSEQLDSYFFRIGEKTGKKIIALETPEFQGEMLFNMTPLTVQAEVLVEMLKNPEESFEAAKKLNEAYKERNLDEMLILSLEDELHPEFMEIILYKRNTDWLNRLPSIIESAPSFIAVGALHLAGPHGVLQGLKDLGFEITPIY